jgi:homocysteine S-methyltransferase
MSGIAGAIVQFLFSDLIGIHTIPAFLLNQFCLACVFWHVDKLIFKRHLGEKLSIFFRFPRIKTAYGFTEQIDKINQEFSDLRAKIIGNEDRPGIWLNEFVDFEHSVEMMERLLRERKIDVDREYERVRNENLKRGYYFNKEAGEENRMRKRSRSGFLEALSKEVLLADGAMGTYLRAKGFDISACLELLNLTNPEVVKKVHEEYIEAGAKIIETNTFAANRFKLAEYGLAGECRKINLAGAKIAKESSKGRVFVAGSVGNLGRLISPYGELSLVEAHNGFGEQIQALADGNVDIIILETMTSFLEAKEAVFVCKEITDIPIICQITFTDEGKTVYGDELVESFEELKEVGADVVGLNCSLGPRMMLELLRSIPPSFTGMVSIQPNAGLPRFRDGSSEYLASPEYFKEYAEYYKNLGVNIIGGCCGTTPAHIREMAGVVSGSPVKRRRPQQMSAQTLDKVVEVSGSEKIENNLIQKLQAKNFITVEISPPKDFDIKPAIKEIDSLKASGADAVNVTENPMARMHMSSIAFCGLVKKAMDVFTVVHFTTRDRNLLGIQSDLLGAAAFGIDGILALKGDPASIGDVPYASSVYDVSTTGLVKIISNLNKGLDLSFNRLGKPSNFAIGVGVNPLAENLEVEIEKLEQRVKQGAHFAITQPIYEINVLEKFMSGIRHLNLPVVVGILPLKSQKNAEYLHNEVPGIKIPKSIREDIKKYSANEGIKRGIEISFDFAKLCLGLVSGFYIMPPRNTTKQVCDLISMIKSEKGN